MTISRRNALPVALFSLLGGRIAVLVASKEEFSPPEQTTFDAAGAIEASRAAGQCPVQSCNKARLTEMQFKLDTSKYAGKPNEKGDAASHRPLVWVEPIKQEGKRPYAAKVVMVAPERRGDTVQLMWLANGATQQIIGSKVIESASSSMHRSTSSHVALCDCLNSLGTLKQKRKQFADAKRRKTKADRELKDRMNLECALLIAC